VKWLHAWFFAAAALGAACNDNAVVGTTGDAVEKAECEPECTNGERCNPDSGQCVECLTRADCADAGMQCDPESFECVQCLKRSDCDEHLVCIDGACASCSNDAQCGDGAKCEDGECQEDDHQDGEDESGSGGSGDDSGDGSGDGSGGSSGKD
jgi:hypothetical protein